MGWDLDGRTRRLMIAGGGIEATHSVGHRLGNLGSCLASFFERKGFLLKLTSTLFV